MGFADRALLCSDAFSGWDDVGGVGAVDANKNVPRFCTNCCLFMVSCFKLYTTLLYKL